MALDLDTGGLDPVADLNADLIGNQNLAQPRDALSVYLSELQARVNAAGLTGYDFPHTTTLRTDLNRLRARCMQSIDQTPGIIHLWPLISDSHLRGFGFGFSDGAGRYDEIDCVYRADQPITRLETRTSETIADNMLSYAPAPGEMVFPNYIIKGDARPGTTFRITSLVIRLYLSSSNITPTGTVTAATTGPFPFTEYVSIGTPQGDIFTMDGVGIRLNYDILVKDQANPVDNGVYRVIVGFVGRFGDVHIGYARVQSINMNGAVIRVLSGTVNGSKFFKQTTPNPVLNVSPLVFVETSGGTPTPNLTAPTRITFAGQTVDGVLLDDTSKPGAYIATHTFAVPIAVTSSPFNLDPHCFHYPAAPGAPPIVSRQIEIYLENFVPASLGNASGGIHARAISPFETDWRRLRAPLIRLQLAPAGIAYIRCTNQINTVPNAAHYWFAKSWPTSYFQHSVTASPAERWLRATSPKDSLITPVDTVADVATAVVSPPHAESIQSVYSDPARVAANWPNYQTFEFTVPDNASVSGPVEFQGADVFFGVDPPFPKNNSVNCYYYKIPLTGILPERELSVAWDQTKTNATLAKIFNTSIGYGARPEYNGVNPVAAARGALATDYFHDARLVSEDGQTFWYRDAFHIFPQDIHQVFRRVPYWTILPDGEHFALYLFGPLFDMAVGYDELGSEIIQQNVGFFPSGKVTAEDYRASYQKWADIFTGNWTDFQAPWRFFGIDPFNNMPIAVWQIGKSYRSDFQPGMRLKLHVPKYISRTPCFNHHIDLNHAIEGTVEEQARYALFVPGTNSPLTREIQDVETIRSDRHQGLLVFRNGVAQIILALVPEFDFDVDDPPDNTATGLAEDLRLYPVGIIGRTTSVVTHAGQIDDYEIENVEGYRDTGAVRIGPEINAGDYTYDPATGTITLHRKDALTISYAPGAGSDAVQLPADEFTYAWVSFRTRTGRRSQISVIYGNWTGGGFPFTFNPYRYAVIGNLAGVTAGNFYRNPSEPASISKPWIKAENWPLVYQKQPASIGSYGLTVDPYTYTVAGITQGDHDLPQTSALTVPGLLVQITPPEDCRLRAKAAWHSAMHYTYAQLKAAFTSAQWTAFTNALGESGIKNGTEIPNWSGTISSQPPNVVRFFGVDSPTAPELRDQYTPSFGPQLVLTDSNSLEPAETDTIRIWVERYAITDFDLLEGPQWIAPRVGSDIVEIAQRLFYFSPESAEQRFEVRAVYYENYGAQPRNHNPANNPAILDIVGPPYACHYNETKRLADAWFAAGKP